jgi:outer membrane lipoprotein LolB
MRLSRSLIALCLLVLLQACASTPLQQAANSAASQVLYQQHLRDLAAINSFSLQGRIGVQADGKGFSGSLHWQHSVNRDDIELFSPLGGQVASIQKTAAQVTLIESNGKHSSAENAETLTAEVLGWRLPLSGLADWSLGRPTQNAVLHSTWDERGFLRTLKQDGWDIEYQAYSAYDGQFLPTKMSLRSEKLNLKLVVEMWLVTDKHSLD